MPETVARASASATGADVTSLAGVAEFLFCAQAIESRAFAFSLTGAKDLDQSLHLAHVGLRRLEPFLLGDDPSHRRGGVGAQQP